MHTYRLVMMLTEQSVLNL